MARTRRNTGLASILLRVALLGFAVYMIFSMISLQSQLSQSKQELIRKQNEIIAKKADVEELSELLKNGSRDELIEREARDKLDFVFKNEDVYEDVSGK